MADEIKTYKFGEDVVNVDTATGQKVETPVVPEPEVINKGNLLGRIQETALGKGEVAANPDFIQGVAKYKTGAAATAEDLAAGGTVRDVIGRFGLGSEMPGFNLPEPVVPTGEVTPDAPVVEEPTTQETLVDYLKGTGERQAAQRIEREEALAPQRKILEEANKAFSDIATRIKNQDLLNVQDVEELGDKPIPNVAIQTKRMDLSREQERSKIFDMMEYNQALAAVQVAQGNYELAESTVQEMADDQAEASKAMIDALEIEGQIEAEEAETLRQQAEFDRGMAMDGYVKIPGPAGLEGLSEEQIIRIPNPTTGGMDIFKLPTTMADRNTQVIKGAGGQSLLIDTDTGETIKNFGASTRGPSGPSRTTETPQDKAFISATKSAVTNLQKGEKWGTVFDRMKQQFPSMSDDQIDTAMGLEWRKEGAFEEYKAKQYKEVAPRQFEQEARIWEELGKKENEKLSNEMKKQYIMSEGFDPEDFGIY